MLRKLADDIESGECELTVTTFNHGIDVVDPELGNMVVDWKPVGTSIVIQTEGIGLETLLHRLLKDFRATV